MTKTIILPENVHRDILRIVAESPTDHETGVSLFGVSVPSVKKPPPETKACFIALAAVGPGPRSIRTPVFYRPDREYANAAYEALRSALPRIRWIGEFHVHPRGMTWLSIHDRRTLRALFAEPELNPSEFFAGIMQRSNEEVTIHPYFCNQAAPEGEQAAIEIVPTSTAIVGEARRHAIAEEVTPLPRGARVEWHQQKDSTETPNICQRWLGSAISLFRRRLFR